MKLKTPLKPVVVGLLSSAILMGCNSDSKPTIELQPAKLEQQVDFSKGEKLEFTSIEVLGNDSEGDLPVIEAGQVFDLKINALLLEEFPTGTPLDVLITPVDNFEDPDDIKKAFESPDSKLLEGYIAQASTTGSHEINIQSIYAPGKLAEGNYNLIVQLAESEEDQEAIESGEYKPVLAWAPIYVDPRPYIDLEIQDVFLEDGELALVTSDEAIPDGQYTQDPVVILESDMINTGDEPIPAYAEAFWIHEGEEYPMGILGEVFTEEGSNNSPQNNSQNIVSPIPRFTVDATTKYVQTVGLSLYADKELHSKMVNNATDLSSGDEDKMHTFKIKWHAEIDGDKTNNEKTFELPLISITSNEFDALEEDTQTLRTRNASALQGLPPLHNGNLFSREYNYKKKWGNEDKFALEFKSENNAGIQILPLPGGYFNSETSATAYMFRAENTLLKFEATGGIYAPIKIPAKNKDNNDGKKRLPPKDEMEISATILGIKVYEKKWDQDDGLQSSTDVNELNKKSADDLEKEKNGHLEKSALSFSYELKKQYRVFKRTFWVKVIPIKVEAGFQFETNPNIELVPHGIGAKLEGKIPTKASIYAKGGVNLLLKKGGIIIEGIAAEIPETITLPSDPERKKVCIPWWGCRYMNIPTSEKEHNVGFEAAAGLVFVEKDIPNTTKKGFYLAYDLNANSYLGLNAIAVRFGLWAKSKKWFRKGWNHYPTVWLYQSDWLYEGKRKLFEYEKSEVPIWKISEREKTQAERDASN